MTYDPTSSLLTLGIRSGGTVTIEEVTATCKRATSSKVETLRTADSRGSNPSSSTGMCFLLRAGVKGS